MQSHKRARTPDQNAGHSHKQISQKLAAPLTQQMKIHVLVEAGFDYPAITVIATQVNGDKKINYLYENRHKLKEFIACEKILRIIAPVKRGLSQLQQYMQFLEKQKKAFANYTPDSIVTLSKMGFTDQEISVLCDLHTKEQYQLIYLIFGQLVALGYESTELKKLVLYRIHSGDFCTLENLKEAHEKLHKLSFTPSEIVQIVKYDKLNLNVNMIIEFDIMALFKFKPIQLTMIVSNISGNCNLKFLCAHADRIKKFNISAQELTDSLSDNPRCLKQARDTILRKIYPTTYKQKATVSPFENKVEEHTHSHEAATLPDNLLFDLGLDDFAILSPPEQVNVEELKFPYLDTAEASNPIEESEIENNSDPRLFSQSFQEAFNENEGVAPNNVTAAPPQQTHENDFITWDPALFLQAAYASTYFYPNPYFTIQLPPFSFDSPFNFFQCNSRMPETPNITQNQSAELNHHTRTDHKF